MYTSPAGVADIDRNRPQLSNRTPSISQFPRRLYKGEPLKVSKTQPNFYREAGVIPYVRDPKIDYFIFKDRDVHPDHHSRFGYPWCENGYCTGNHPGRYNTPPAMMWMSDPLPEDMAPARFYKGDQISPNYSDSEAYISSRRARAIRANLA